MTPEALRSVGAATVRRNDEGKFSGQTMVWVIRSEEVVEGDSARESSTPIVKCLLTGQYYFPQADGTLKEVDPQTERRLRSEVSISEKFELLVEIARLSRLFPETATALLKDTLGSCRGIGRRPSFTPSPKPF